MPPPGPPGLPGPPGSLPPPKLLSNLQEGTLWGQFMETWLFGLYTCLFIVTIRRPIMKRKRLTSIGWIIVVIYWLTVGRFVADFRTMYRTLFVTCGDPNKLESNDYVLRGFQNGLTFTACIISDSLFCWRLYVIWSRNVRIILIPAFLLVLNTIGCTLIVIADFHLAYQPKDERYQTAYVRLWMVVLGIVIAYTAYTTLFIVGRLWSVGGAVNKFVPSQEVKGNRYRAVMNALIQSGGIYLTAMVLYMCALGSESVILVAAVRGISADANSISSILLFLQLDLFQEREKHAHIHGPPLTTGATINFANRGTTSTAEGGWSRVSAARFRRTSMPAYLDRDSDSSAATSRLDGSLPDKKEPVNA
ncbi:hypothetical protein FRB94_012983 [Tulasnella sp. JGI-2019a]|nr:hypothetical protein FRB94_012983 [Tulasnella sp. JGI-2019a]